MRLEQIPFLSLMFLLSKRDYSHSMVAGGLEETS
jgi:hypothetical protein